MIRIHAWLHPFLIALADKVQELKSSMERLHRCVDDALVLAKVGKSKVPKPMPTNRMSHLAHAAIDRAVLSDESHVRSLLQGLDELRLRSAPSRLPEVGDEVGGAVLQLQEVLTSQRFRLCVGDAFPSLPRIAGADTVGPMFALDEASAQQSAADCDEACVEILIPPTKDQLRGARDSDQGCGVASLLLLDSADADTKLELAPVEEASTCSVASSLQQTGPPTLESSRPIGSCGAFSPAPQPQVQQQPHAGGVLPPQQVLSESVSSQPPGFERNVWRLAQSRFGPYQYRHDRRSLHLTHGRLQVYQKGSSTEVKVESAISDLSELVFEGAFLRFTVTRPGVRFGCSRANLGEEDSQLKAYSFEFDSIEAASEFEVQLRNQEEWAQSHRYA